MTDLELVLGFIAGAKMSYTVEKRWVECLDDVEVIVLRADRELRSDLTMSHTYAFTRDGLSYDLVRGGLRKNTSARNDLFCDWVARRIYHEND